VLVAADALDAARTLVLDAARGERPTLGIMELADLGEELGPARGAFVAAVLAVDPAPHGVRAPNLGLEPAVPADLVALRQPDWPVVYLAPALHERVCALDEALYADTGLRFHVDSGYRSPAHQVLTFAWYFAYEELDLGRTVRRCVPPAYSEHCRRDHAVDFTAPDGFAGTPQHAWLCANAAEHGLVGSYPEGNALGVMPEPWHWRAA
jgi:hypothetical protein